MITHCVQNRYGEHVSVLAGPIQNQSVTSGIHPTFISTSRSDLASVFGKNTHDVELFILFHRSVLELDICNITRLARVEQLHKKACRCT